MSATVLDTEPELSTVAVFKNFHCGPENTGTLLEQCGLRYQLCKVVQRNRNTCVYVCVCVCGKRSVIRNWLV